MNFRKRTNALDSLKNTQPTALLFDGRKDKETLVRVGGATRRVTVDHYSVVAEPGDHYMGFAIPQSGTGECFGTVLYSLTDEYDYSCTDILILNV